MLVEIVIPQEYLSGDAELSRVIKKVKEHPKVSLIKLEVYEHSLISY